MVLRPLDCLQINPLLHHLPQRRHIPQLIDVFDDCLDCIVHFLICGKAANPKANGSVGKLFIDTQRAEDVRWLKGR